MGGNSVLALYAREWRGSADTGHQLRTSGAPSRLLSGGFEDQVRDFIGMRDQREMAGLHLDRLGAHALGHEPLEVRIDRAVLGRNGVVSRLRSPCRVRGLAGEQSFVERLLHGIE